MSSVAALEDVGILLDILSSRTADFDVDAARAILRLEFSENKRRECFSFQIGGIAAGSRRLNRTKWTDFGGSATFLR